MKPCTVLLIASLTTAPLHAQDDVVPTSAEVAQAVQDAVDLLVHQQESYVADPAVGRLPDEELEAWQAREAERLDELRGAKEPGHEWPYEGVYRVGSKRQIPPGYRVGGTAIVCEALLNAPGFADSDARKSAVARSITFMLSELESNKKLAPGPKRGYDVRGWGHTYALQFFLRALDEGIVDDALTVVRIERMIAHLIDCIATNETSEGGWNYAGDSVSPFMTGSTLLTLSLARAHGHAVDDGMIDRALDALQKGRAKNGAFAYSGAARRNVAMPGSSARSSAAELCLYLAGRSTEDDLRVAVMGFFMGWNHLLDRKSKQGTHEGSYGIAPYYFYYGHTYVAAAIEFLPEDERPELRDELRKLVWRTREKNGGWNDRVFPRTSSYSTAMVVQALLAPDLKPVPALHAATADGAGDK